MLVIFSLVRKIIKSRFKINKNKWFLEKIKINNTQFVRIGTRELVVFKILRTSIVRIDLFFKKNIDSLAHHIKFRGKKE
jgi:hypothetical protein